MTNKTITRLLILQKRTSLKATASKQAKLYTKEYCDTRKAQTYTTASDVLLQGKTRYFRPSYQTQPPPRLPDHPQNAAARSPCSSTQYAAPSPPTSQAAPETRQTSPTPRFAHAARCATSDGPPLPRPHLLGGKPIGGGFCW